MPKESSQVRQQQVPMDAVYPIHITSGYTFIRRDVTFLVFSHIAYSLFYFFLGILFFRLIGSQRTYGKRNLRKLKGKGGITVANHCHLFDTVLTAMAVNPRRPWYASAQRNFEAPYYRKMFRILRGFPIPETAMGLKRITKTVVEAVHRGRLVHFFPEEELWPFYQGIDHFQKGAFYLAHQANCPILPIVHAFRPRRFFGKEISRKILKVRSFIGEPVYPPQVVEEGKAPDRQSVNEMSDLARGWMIRQLEEFHSKDQSAKKA